MKKRIFLVCLLGFIIAFMMFNSITKKDQEAELRKEKVQVVGAFRELDITAANCRLESMGQWKKGIYSYLEKQQLLEVIARDLGIEEHYEWKISATALKERADLTVNGKHANTVLSVITDIKSEENFVLIQVEFAEVSESVLFYKEQTQKSMKENHIKGNVVIDLYGYYDGELNQEQKDSLSNAFFNKMEADQHTGYNKEELYTIYGYTKLIPEYLLIEGEKMNLNLAISYNELEDKTDIYIGTPLLKRDY